MTADYGVKDTAITVVNTARSSVLMPPMIVLFLCSFGVALCFWLSRFFCTIHAVVAWEHVWVAPNKLRFPASWRPPPNVRPKPAKETERNHSKEPWLEHEVFFFGRLQCAVTIFSRALCLFRAQGVDGEVTKIKGTATAKNLMKPGQLTVHFEGTPARFGAPYWIVALGDEDGVSIPHRSVVVLMNPIVWSVGLLVLLLRRRRRCYFRWDFMPTESS